MPFDLRGLLVPTALIATAEIGGRMTDLTHSTSLAVPSAIVNALFGALANGSLLAATWDTLAMALAGLALGGGLGLVLGLLLGLAPTIDKIAEVPIEALRPIPTIAVLPIALIAWALDITSKWRSWRSPASGRR